MTAALPPKKEVALALLERSSVHVHLDPRASGVVVPSWFKKQPQLVLQIGLNMPVPIPDLRLDEEGMSCTLSFNRTPFYCVVPWHGVYAMVGDDGRGMVWPDDVPPEVANQAQGREGEGETVRRALPGRAPARGSRLVAAPEAGKTPEPARASKEQRAKEAPATSKAKKPRKRRGEPQLADPDPARPTLVAVSSAHAKKDSRAMPPRPDRGSPGVDPLGASQGEARGGPVTPPQTGAPWSPPTTEAERGGPPAARIVPGERRPRTAARPKRELPPYLRVVK
jgi:stringent starvation protein B